MSNYNSLKATIDANIKQNGNQEITGQILNSVLNAMVTTLGTGYQFAGVATIATNPGTPDAKVFYIANGKGTYEKFGGLEVTEDDVVVFYWDSSWHKESTGIASQAKLSELESKAERMPISNNANLNAVVKELYINNIDFSQITKVFIYKAVPMGGGYLYGVLMRSEDNVNVIDTRIFTSSQEDALSFCKNLFITDKFTAIIDWEKIETGAVFSVSALELSNRCADIEYSPTIYAHEVESRLNVNMLQKVDESSVVFLLPKTRTVDLTGGSTGYISNEGKYESALSSFQVTKPIHLFAGDKFKYTAVCDVSFSCLSETSENNNASLRFHKPLILGKGENLSEYEYVAEREMYVEITYMVSFGVTTYTLENTDYNKRISQLENPNEKDICPWIYAVKKVLCIGDSLTEGAYFTNNTSSGITIEENYPFFLGKMLNAEVTNAGITGISASGWYLNEMSKYNFANYDTFIIWLGTNQAPTTDIPSDVSNPVDETGYYCAIIESIKAANPDAFIVMCSIFTSKSSMTLAKRKMPLIAQKYNLPYLDMQDLSQTTYPELHNNIDNPHFNKAGNIFVANRIARYINGYFKESPMRCEFGVTTKRNVNV